MSRMTGLTRRDLLRTALAASVALPLAGRLGVASAAPTLTTIDRPLALSLANICRLTVTQFQNNGSFPVPPGYRLVVPFRATASGRVEWFGFILESSTTVVLAFRSTQSAPDWIADADIAHVTYPYVSGAGMTHQGFTNIYRSCRNDIIPALDRLSAQKTLYVTGHSLGAALAVASAPDVAANTPFTNPVMYNFAGPRVGDPQFVAAYTRLVRTSVRVVNVHDIVPMMPGAGYVHVPAEYRISFQTGSIVGNHILTNYIKALQG